MKDILLIGGGGHCLSCIDVIERTAQYNIIGILDLPDMVGERILNYPVVGTDDDIMKFVKKGSDFCISIGQMSAGESLKRRIFDKVSVYGASLPTIFSTDSVVSHHAYVGKGVIILANSFINANVRIGDNCIINTGAVIEHGVSIGSHTHISTSVTVNGDCKIGSQCFIGSGAKIRNNVKITDDVLIGMGSVVTRNIDIPGTYMGNPLRKVK